MFLATLAEIRANHTTDSDQFYMAEVYGRQEFARLQREPELLERYRSVRYAEELENATIQATRSDPKTDGLRTEYHIGIDFESRMFQTLAYWKQYLTWMRPVDSWVRSGEGEAVYNNPYTLHLPVDITEAQAPVRSFGLPSEYTLTDNAPVRAFGSNIRLRCESSAVMERC